MPNRNYIRLEDAERADAWLDAERHVLLALALASAEDSPRMTVLLSQFVGYHWACAGHNNQARALHETAAHAARKLNEPATEARILYRLGEVCGIMNDLTAAGNHLAESAAAAKLADDPRSAAMAYWGLGETLRLSAEYAKALAQFEDSATMAAVRAARRGVEPGHRGTRHL